MTLESWDQVMDINAKGVFLGTKAAIPAMRQAGGGSIINLSSIAGLVGSTYSASYNASKGAVRLLTKSTAIQYAKEGIRANSIHPGLIDTLMAADLLADDDLRQRRIATTPMGRVGTAEEVANGALYLASDESSFVTGSEFRNPPTCEVMPHMFVGTWRLCRRLTTQALDDPAVQATSCLGRHLPVGFTR